MNQLAPLDVIAVGAHPDDVEIACGGTLAKLVRQGYRVGIIDLTDGEPTPGSPGPHVRLAEAERAAETLGVHVRVQLGSAESPAVRFVRGPGGAGQGAAQISAEAGAGLRREDAAGLARPLAGDADHRRGRVLFPADASGTSISTACRSTRFRPSSITRWPFPRSNCRRRPGIWWSTSATRSRPSWPAFAATPRSFRRPRNTSTARARPWPCTMAAAAGFRRRRAVCQSADAGHARSDAFPLRPDSGRPAAKARRAVTGHVPPVAALTAADAAAARRACRSDRPAAERRIPAARRSWAR